MDISECITWLKILRANMNTFPEISADKKIEALTMAIKALEQEPILDKIREQIKSNIRGVEITLEVLAENDPLIPKMEGAKDTLENCLEIIDKAESEIEDGTN